MKPFRHQTVLYILTFLLALAVRLIRLGTWTLTDTEAQWALQALNVAKGLHPALGSQPAYVLLTSIIFFFYGGGTNFWARFVPALAGSFLVFVPFLFRERLKPRAIAPGRQFDPRRDICFICVGFLATEAIALGWCLCGTGFAFRSVALGRFARPRNLMGDSSSDASAPENRVRSTPRAQRMDVRIVVWNRYSACWRDAVLFVAQRIERVALLFAGIFEWLDTFIGNPGRHDIVLVDCLSATGRCVGIDCHPTRLDEEKQARDAAEHLGFGRAFARAVLSIPPGERFGLDAHPVVVAGRIGIGTRNKYPAGRTAAGDRCNRIKHIHSFLRLASIFGHHHPADSFFGSE